MDEPKVVYRYTGRTNDDGEPQEFYAGVPARDLTEADVADLPPARLADVKAGVIYEKAGADKAPAKTDKAAAPKPAEE